jgi:hypothetical protein
VGTALNYARLSLRDQDLNVIIQGHFGSPAAA